MKLAFAILEWNTILKTEEDTHLTISVRQATTAAQRTMTLEDDRPLDRHASGDRNVKF